MSIREKIGKVADWYNNSKYFKGAVEATASTLKDADDFLEGCKEKSKVFNFCSNVWEAFETSKDFYGAVKEIWEPCLTGVKIGSHLGGFIGGFTGGVVGVFTGGAAGVFTGGAVGGAVGRAAGGAAGRTVGGAVGGFIGGVISLRKAIKNWRELTDKFKQIKVARDSLKILSKTDLDLMDKKSVKESIGRMFARVGVCNPSEAKAVLDAVDCANDYILSKGSKKPPQNLLNNPVFNDAFTTLVNYRRLDNKGYENDSSNLKAAYSSTIAAKCANSTELLGKISDALLKAKESTESHLQALSECLLGSENEQIVVEALHTSIEYLERAEMNVKASINSIEDYVKNNFSC